MAYLRTGGGLEPTADRYLREMADALRAPGLRVVAQVEQLARPGFARRLRLECDGTRELEPTACGDMDRPAALRDFLRWAREQAPADRLLLLALGHSAPTAPDSAGGLDPDTLATALLTWQGPRLDLVFLDCCNAGSLEMADQLQGAARFLVAPPHVLCEPGLPWGQILGALQARPGLSARGLAALAVRATREFWSGHPEVPAGLVAVDLERLAPLGEAVRHLGQTGIERMGELAPGVTLARAQAAPAGGGDFVDLAALADGLASLAPSPAVAEAATRVVRETRAVTVAAWVQQPADPGTEGWGLSVFFAVNGDSWRSRLQAQRSPSFAAAWEAFCAAYLERLSNLARQEDSRGLGVS